MEVKCEFCGTTVLVLTAERYVELQEALERLLEEMALSGVVAGAELLVPFEDVLKLCVKRHLVSCPEHLANASLERMRAAADVQPPPTETDPRAPGPIPALTDRERQVAILLAGGITTDKDIARALKIARTTARNYVQALMAKFGQDNRAALAARLVAEGFAPASGNPVI